MLIHCDWSSDVCSSDLDISTDDNILEEPDQIQDEERLAAGDAALAKVIEKTTKKEKPVIEEEEEFEEAKKRKYKPNFK
jgi:hypothetical protein